MNRQWYDEARHPGTRPRSVGRFDERLISYDRSNYGAQVRLVRFDESGEGHFWQMTLQEFSDDKTMQRRVKQREGQKKLKEILDFYQEQQDKGKKKKFRLPWSR